MRPQSAKAKGRRLQQEVAQLIRDRFALPDSDVKSIPMGSQGCDIWLSAHAQVLFPFAVECKNVEKLNVAQAFEQAKTYALNGRDIEEVYPLLVHSKNRSETLATLRLDDLIEILKRCAD